MPQMMPEHHVAQGDGLNRAPDRSRLDVLANPEGVIEQEEEPGEHIGHQFLGPEADRQPNHARHRPAAVRCLLPERR